MPRMWLTKEENPLKLSTFLLKSNEMSDMHFARKIARLGIAAHPNPIQKNYSEHSSFAIVFANGASSKEICEKINNVQDGFQATIDVASNCSPSLAKHSQEVITFGIHNAMCLRGWCLIGNPQKLEQLWVRNLDLTSPKMMLDAVKMEMLFTPSPIVGKVGMKISLEPLKVTLRRRGALRVESPEVFILPHISRGIVSDDQTEAIEQTSLDFIANTSWMDAAKHTSVEERGSTMGTTWIEVSSGNVEDGDMSENDRFLVPNVLLLSEEPTQKKMSKKDSERVLQDLKDMLVSVGLPSSLKSTKVNKTVDTTTDNGGENGEDTDSVWSKGQSLSVSPPLFANGKGVTLAFSSKKLMNPCDQDHEQEEDAQSTPSQMKVIANVCVDFELFSAKMSTNTPSFPNSLQHHVSSVKKPAPMKKGKRNCLEIDTSITESEVEDTTNESSSKDRVNSSVLLPVKDSSNQAAAKPAKKLKADKRKTSVNTKVSTVVPPVNSAKDRIVLMKVKELKLACERNHIKAPGKFKKDMIQQLLALPDFI